MSKSTFTKAPLTYNEREKKLEAFLNPSDTSAYHALIEQKTLKKEKTKPVYLRAPESLWDDIHEIMARTGLSMNAICLDLLRPAIKRKLKEIKEF